jgi:hypothetical protein
MRWLLASNRRLHDCYRAHPLATEYITTRYHRTAPRQLSLAVPLRRSLSTISEAISGIILNLFASIVSLPSQTAVPLGEHWRGGLWCYPGSVPPRARTETILASREIGT